MKILSFNVSWESMTGKKSEWGLCNNKTDRSNPKHYMNCINNVANLIDDNGDYDFVSLQEAANYKKIIDNSKILKKMNNHVGISGKEEIVTFWNEKYKLLNYIDGDFESGRPYNILIFRQLIIINVHLGHYNKEILYNKLRKPIGNINMYNGFKPKRIIMMGDFNGELQKYFGSKLKLNQYTFYINKKIILTCCSNIAKENKYTQQVDHIIDTKKAPVTYTIEQDDLLRSDHLPIFALIS
jgi:hypothetical protein